MQQLEVVKDIGLVLFEVVVSQQEFLGHEGYELQRRAEARGEFVDKCWFVARS